MYECERGMRRRRRRRGKERTQGVITRVTQSLYRINKRVLTVNATYVRT